MWKKITSLFRKNKPAKKRWAYKSQEKTEAESIAEQMQKSASLGLSQTLVKQREKNYKLMQVVNHEGY